MRRLAKDWSSSSRKRQSSGGVISLKVKKKFLEQALFRRRQVDLELGGKGACLGIVFTCTGGLLSIFEVGLRMVLNSWREGTQQ